MGTFKINQQFFPTKVGRLDYVIRWVIYLAGVMILAALILPAPRSLGIPQWTVFIILIPLFLIRIPFMDVPRFRSIGWSPWLVLLFLVPFINFIVQLLLFFTPSKGND